jgi:hypothetical protein
MICQWKFASCGRELGINLWMQPKAASISPIMLALRSKSTKFADSFAEERRNFRVMRYLFLWFGFIGFKSSEPGSC